MYAETDDLNVEFFRPGKGQGLNFHLEDHFNKS